MGVAPAFIIDLILTASSVSQLLLCFVLPSASLGQSNQSVKQSWGRGSEKRIGNVGRRRMALDRARVGC